MELGKDLTPFFLVVFIKIIGNFYGKVSYNNIRINKRSKRMGNKKITISFKNTTSDTKLYLAIQELEEKSQGIKDILYKALIEDKKNKK